MTCEEAQRSVFQKKACQNATFRLTSVSWCKIHIVADHLLDRRHRLGKAQKGQGLGLWDLRTTTSQECAAVPRKARI